MWGGLNCRGNCSGRWSVVSGQWSVTAVVDGLRLQVGARNYRGQGSGA